MATLKEPETRDPKHAFETQWNSAYLICRDKCRDPIKAAELMQKLSYICDLNSYGYVPRDTEEQYLQNKIQKIRKSFHPIFTLIQSVNDVPDSMWKEFQDILECLRPS